MQVKRPDPSTRTRDVPIYQTTSYIFDSARNGSDLFALKEFGNYLYEAYEPDN